MTLFQRCFKWRATNELNRCFFSLPCLTLLVVFGCGSKTVQLAGHWRDRDIAIDGVHEEWQEGMNYIEKENVENVSWVRSTIRSFFTSVW